MFIMIIYVDILFKDYIWWDDESVQIQVSKHFIFSS